MLEVEDAAQQCIGSPFYCCEWWESSKMRSLRKKKKACVLCSFHPYTPRSPEAGSQIPFSRERAQEPMSVTPDLFVAKTRWARLLLLSRCSSGDSLGNSLSLMSVEPACPAFPSQPFLHPLIGPSASTSPLNSFLPRVSGFVLSCSPHSRLLPYFRGSMSTCLGGLATCCPSVTSHLLSNLEPITFLPQVPPLSLPQG